jgi:hypothetical protein
MAARTWAALNGFDSLFQATYNYLQVPRVVLAWLIGAPPLSLAREGTRRERCRGIVPCLP